MIDLWYEIEIRIGKDAQELLVAFMSDLGCRGFAEEDDVLKCYIKKDEWTNAKASELNNFLTRLNDKYTMSINQIENRNWNALWESTIEPIEVTERIVIKPTWKSYGDEKGKIIITIDPKMSFGTGYHETTKLMLRLMEEFVKPRDIVLDVGSGTGILAITAVKLGAQKAIGIDNDEWSFQNANENIALNGIQNRVEIRLGTISDVIEREFNLIVANLTRNTILEMLADLKGRLKDNGILILSGLLRDDEKTIHDALERHRFNIIKTLIENEWIAVAGRKDVSRISDKE